MPGGDVVDDARENVKGVLRGLVTLHGVRDLGQGIIGRDEEGCRRGSKVEFNTGTERSAACLN